MLKSVLIAALVFSTSIATRGVAQDIDINPYELRRHYESPAQRRAREAQEELDRLTACAMMSMPETAPFGYWGHGHARAHCLGWTEELMRQTNSKCCGGLTNGGECRLAAVDVQKKIAYIDGMACPFSAEPRVIADMDGGLALVCASRISFEEMGSKPICPMVHCVGIAGGS